jgi:hypothetical protein
VKFWPHWRTPSRFGLMEGAVLDLNHCTDVVLLRSGRWVRTSGPDPGARGAPRGSRPGARSCRPAAHAFGSATHRSAWRACSSLAPSPQAIPASLARGAPALRANPLRQPPRPPANCPDRVRYSTVHRAACSALGGAVAVKVYYEEPPAGAAQRRRPRRLATREAIMLKFLNSQGCGFAGAAPWPPFRAFP